MSTPTLPFSQELTVHQMNAEQSFSPISIPLHNFPSSPQLQRQRQGDAVTLSAMSSFTPTPGGSNSTMPATIVRPEVRRRREWDLSSVKVFHLPSSALRQDASASCGGVYLARQVMIRYIADRYDQEWLTHWSSLQPEAVTPHPSCPAGTITPQSCSGKVGDIGGKSVQELSLSPTIEALEATLTTFEVKAFCNPQVGLEQISLSSTELADELASTSSCVLERFRQYWLRKRAAMGGGLPCLSALRVCVGEEREYALCTKDVLGDCPLPFKQRDWFVPAYRRRGTVTRPDVYRKKVEMATLCTSSMQDVDTVATSDDYYGAVHSDAICPHVAPLCSSVLKREQMRRLHTHLALYEIAVLRRLICFQKNIEECQARNQIVSLDDLFLEQDSCAVVVNVGTLTSILFQSKRSHQEGRLVKDNKRAEQL